MGRGGRRTGAGRPRKNIILGFPGGAPVAGSAAPPRPPAPEDVAALSEPPADLPSVIQSPSLAGVTLTSQADFWRRYAPLAIDQRTLVPATVPGFREVCELAALKEEVAAKLQKWGSEGKTGSDRMRTYTRLSQRLDAALGRFKLTAFGKPADGGVSKRPAANPFAQVGTGA